MMTLRGASSTVWMARIRAVLLPIALLWGAYHFGTVLDKHYPIKQWLFWQLAPAWIGSLVFVAACLSSGHAIVSRLGAVRERPLDHLALSFAAGVLAFFGVMFLAGLVGLFVWPTFFVVPALLIGVGARSFYRWAKRRRALFQRLKLPGGGPAPWAWPIIFLGFLGVALVYVPILTPDNTAYDARWYHLALAEHYVAQGRIGTFPDGWIVSAIPHLSSFLYAWAFLLPKSEIFARVVFAAHLEFCIFLFTLAAIPGLVRTLVPRARVGTSWVALFLFPGIFVYDSSLTTAADHIAALWSIPIWLSLRRAWGGLSPRACALFALFASGALLTKYTSVMVVAVPVMAIVLRGIWLGVVAWRARKGGEPLDRRFYVGPLVALGVGFLATSPHWLRNLIEHHDPIYPLLWRHVHERPWGPDAHHILDLYNAGNWTPRATTKQNVVDALRVLWTFSFEPHDWDAFHGKVPVFGSLFTLTALSVPLVKGAWRSLGVILATHVAIFIWWFVNHQDRYLQALVPWMAATTIAIIILAWRTGWAARIAVCALVAIQVIWGADAPFLPAHAMLGGHPLNTVTELFTQGYRKNYAARMKVFSPWSEIARELPPKSKVVIHESHVHLGIGAPTVVDWMPGTFGLNYGRLGSPRAVYDLLRSWGVTHIAYSTGSASGQDTIAGDLVFFHLVSRYGTGTKAYGGETLTRLPSVPPPEVKSPPVVGFFGCDSLSPGLYELPDLVVFPAVTGESYPTYRAPRTPWNAGDRPSFDALVGKASYIVVNHGCHGVPSDGLQEFTKMGARGTHELWVRTSGQPKP